MPLDGGNLFLYLYAAVVLFILTLGGIFYLLKRRYGNVLFLTRGTIELSPYCRIKVKQVLPFMGEGYLIFVEVETPSGSYCEVWGYSRNGGFTKISKIGE